MQLIRKEDISVYLYIKDQVLGPRYAEPYLGASLLPKYPLMYGK